MAAPEITLTPDIGAIGTRITISGDNFLSYVGDKLSIFFNDTEIAESPVTISQQGSFQAIMDIPDNAPSGITWVTVKGPLGSVLAQSSLFIPAAAINLDTAKGNVGTNVIIFGEGFYSDKMVTFSYIHNGTVDKLDTVIASMIGEFRYEFTIPVSPGGKNRIIAENAQGNTAETEFEVIPEARVIPESGTVNLLAAVNGTGFGSNSEVTYYFFPELFEIVHQSPALLIKQLCKDQQSSACFSHHERFLLAVNETDTKLLLKFLYLERDRRLTDGQLLSYL